MKISRPYLKSECCNFVLQCWSHNASLASSIVCQWANQSPLQLFPCKSSPLWLHYFTSVTLLQYSWEISISYWPKIASVVSFHLLSGLCWRSDLLWGLQSIPQNASECFWPWLQAGILSLLTRVFSISVQFKLLITLMHGKR